jgi:hypothetical protein
VEERELFLALVETLLAQFRLLPPARLEPDAVCGHGALWLAEALEDTGDPELAAKGRKFRRCLRPKPT